MQEPHANYTERSEFLISATARQQTSCAHAQGNFLDIDSLLFEDNNNRYLEECDSPLMLKNFQGFEERYFIVELLLKPIKMRGTAIEDGGWMKVHL